MNETSVSNGPSGPPGMMSPPASQLGTLRRPRLEDAVSFSDGSHRTTVVSAPAGYGKTTLLAEWSRASGVVCAWLSLGTSNDNAGDFHRWLVEALKQAAAHLHGPARDALLGLDPNPEPDIREDCRRVVQALERLSEPMALVIDDLQLAGPDLDDGLLGTLVRSGPPLLHLVLSSRGDPALSLAAQRLRGTVTDIGSEDLAFTLEETSELLAIHGFDGQLECTGLWNVTAGWPIALAEGLILREGGVAPADAFSPEPRRAFSEYVAEEVLARCPSQVANFILRATTRDTIGSQLAIDLSGDADGAMLLTHCLNEGLFLVEERSSGPDAEYRWQPLFAATCRAILNHRDPLIARALHGTTARHYQDVDVPTCVSEALLGHEPETAVKSIGNHWLEVILGGSAATLEQLCLGLPFPWSEDPEMLLVRSACRGLAGDRSASAALDRRALAGLGGIGAGRRDRFEINRALFELFILGNGDPGATVRKGRRLVDRAAEHPTSALANALFLQGRTETRSPRPGRASTELLHAATAAGRANGLTAIEVSAGAEFALAHSVNGDFAAAAEQGAATLVRAEETAWVCRERLAPIWIARGVAGYWQDDLTRSDAALTQALAVGSDPFPGDSLAIIYRVLVDCATGESAGIAASSSVLKAFENKLHDGSMKPTHGEVLRTIAAAKLREAVGDLKGAAGLVRPLAKGGVSPLANVLVAELLRAAGEPDRALACVEAHAGEADPPYIEASAALTEALIAQSSGNTATAHERVEYALACSEPESILRPFVERRPDLLPLLVQHSAWGTDHDGFLAATLAHRPPERVRRRQRASWTLSRRELEVLVYMRSMLTSAEIADSLFVSVNTIKTHQGSIYRKLGVTSRRSAIRVAMARGLI